MSEAVGLKAAVADAIEDAGDVVLQPSLFPASEIARLPVHGLEREQALRTRGPGRPPGALNTRTKQVREWFLGRYDHPLIGFGETYSRPVKDLASELGCTKLEAAKLQQDARKAALEYIEGKMPVTVNVNGQGIIPVFFEAFEDHREGALEVEHYQELSAPVGQGGVGHDETSL